MITLFIFRRDLRLYDNTTLYKLRSKYPNASILPIFIFNKNQIDEKYNKYYSKNAAQFLFESLEELSFLNFYYTDNDIDIINELHKKYNFDVISYNKDYTPYAKKRDNEINNWAIANNIEILAEEVELTKEEYWAILEEKGIEYKKTYGINKLKELTNAN